MATNFVSEGKILDYTNAGAAISAGDVVVMQDTVGVALVDIAATTGVGAVAIEGVFTLAKVAGTAWVQGDNIDWDTSASAFQKGLTPASGDIASAGIAAVAAASAATTAQVKLFGGGAAAVVT